MGPAFSAEMVKLPPDTVLNYPSFPCVAEVHKMIRVYRASIDEVDVASIDHLTETQRTK